MTIWNTKEAKTKLVYIQFQLQFIHFLLTFKDIFQKLEAPELGPLNTLTRHTSIVNIALYISITATTAKQILFKIYSLNLDKREEYYTVNALLLRSEIRYKQKR